MVLFFPSLVGRQRWRRWRLRGLRGKTPQSVRDPGPANQRGVPHDERSVVQRLCSVILAMLKIMHLSMLSSRGERGEDLGAYVGYLTFPKNCWSKSPLWGPKIWSNQIKTHLDEWWEAEFCINIKTAAYLYYRVRTGPGKPGKSWNFIMAFSRISRTGKSCKMDAGPGKSWKSVKLN